MEILLLIFGSMCIFTGSFLIRCHFRTMKYHPLLLLLLLWDVALIAGGFFMNFNSFEIAKHNLSAFPF